MTIPRICRSVIFQAILGLGAWALSLPFCGALPAVLPSALPEVFPALIPEAHASMDRIECWDESCLTRGWTEHSDERGTFQDHGCVRDDCASNGWISAGSTRQATFSQCLSGGCFLDGWIEQDRWTREKVRTVRCGSGPDGAGDCLKFGWEAYSAAGISVTRCLSGGCRTAGWTTIHPGYRYEESRCLKGDCYRFGWVTAY